MGWNGRKVTRLANLVVGRYGSVCHLCGLPIDLSVPRMEPGGLSVDHVLPRSRGGTDDLSNLRPAHRRCNVRRQNKTISEFRPSRRNRLASGWL